MDMDKIARLVKIGPDDIVDQVYPVHERARVLLENLPDWGTAISDSLGQRLQITAPTAAEMVGLARAENVSSEQIKRVFEKIDELAADSPRKVSVEKRDDDVLALTMETHEGSE